MKELLILILALIVTSVSHASQERAKQAIHAFHNGMVSENLEVNQATLKKYLPSSSDYIQLFGEAGRLLSNRFTTSKLLERIINDAGSLSEKLRRKGEITDISLEEVVSNNSRYEAFFDELKLLPENTTVYIPSVKYERVSGGPFHARVVITPEKELLIVGFERLIDVAMELQATPNKQRNSDSGAIAPPPVR
jgi:hypothetical protein